MYHDLADEEVDAVEAARMLEAMPWLNWYGRVRALDAVADASGSSREARDQATRERTRFVAEVEALLGLKGED